MSDQPRTLEEMSCEELLAELANLSSERDNTQAAVATPEQASAEQAPQVAGMLNQADRMDQIGALLKQKNCQGVA